MVSICVPIYNTEKYLKRSIESLLNQTYTDIEVVLVNDGSTDQSGEICEEFKRQDIRVKVVHQANGGEASARNAGLRAAIGEYICFMDSDDEYYPEAIESMLEVLEENDADLSFGGYIETGAHGTHFAIAHTLEYTKEDIAGEMLKWACPYGDSYIFSTVNGKLFKASLISVC